MRDGNPADQEVVRDGNMPTKRSYESKVCRPRGRTNRKFADQKVVRIGKPANLDLDLEQKRSGESGILTTWRLCEPEILTTWRSCESEISLDQEIVRVGDFTQPGDHASWRFHSTRRLCESLKDNREVVQTSTGLARGRA